MTVELTNGKAALIPFTPVLFSKATVLLNFLQSILGNFMEL